jgi:hypothetical protein
MVPGGRIKRALRWIKRERSKDAQKRKTVVKNRRRAEAGC